VVQKVSGDVYGEGIVVVVRNALFFVHRPSKVR
jgi:hypothetical protein